MSSRSSEASTRRRPSPAALLVAADGLKVLASASDDVIFQWPYDKIKKFQCLSERTVSVIVEVHGADVEKYFRSHDSKAREIVALITAFVKELVAQRVKSAEDSQSSGGGGGGGGARRHGGRSRHKSKKKSGKTTHRSRGSRSPSVSGGSDDSQSGGGTTRRAVNCIPTGSRRRRHPARCITITC
jgi:hypothetical protein